jgi:cysteine desulfurase/selenocysteine lyase
MRNIRDEFPVLQKTFGGKPLTYLDSTASTQKPHSVIEAMDSFYKNNYSSVKRGVYQLSETTTQSFERTRGLIKDLIGADKEEEIIFTKGTTESINLVVSTWARQNLNAGDVLLLSQLEHHANIVPWQILQEEKKFTIKVIPCNDKAELDQVAYEDLLDSNVKCIGITHIANSVGTVNPIASMIKLARAKTKATIVVDAAQSIAHEIINVQELDCDFLAFSGHKMYGPTGIGVLYGKYNLLTEMPPYHGGGEMIDQVSFKKTTYALPPAKFEAGTPAIAEVIGLGAAIDFINKIGLEKIKKHEYELTYYATKILSQIPGLKWVGEAKHKAGILGFTLDCAHAHDAAMILDEEAIAIRAGHHCAQPTMERFGVSATIRASIGVYNNKKDIDTLKSALLRVCKLFA